jgi:hypothetical protein
MSKEILNTIILDVDPHSVNLTVEGGGRVVSGL